ncbi:MAG: insulinase family protein [Candidatus Omnitrophica bacterium]|nr:insulinase family protein [Candidatus Omnitrophota bacterium]
MLKQITLNNGLNIVWADTPLNYSSAVGVWIKKGASAEKLSLKGLAHFLEHMLFKGSKNFSQKEIKKEIEGRGGQLNAFTSQEITCYFALTSFANLSVAAEVLLDIVLYPLLCREDIERERGVILEEIKMYKDMPSQRVLALLDSLLWKDSPLGEEIIGKEESVRRIQKRDLQEFKAKAYIPLHMVITIISHNYPQKIIELIKKKTSHLRNKPFRTTPYRYYNAAGDIYKQELTSFKQTHLSIGFNSFGYLAREKFFLKLLHVILGANMSSRLFESIREKRGLCYEVSTSLKHYRNSGAFIVHIGLDIANVAAAFKIVLKELARLKEKMVGISELKRAKDYFLGNFAMAQEIPQDLMFYLGENICYGAKDYSFSQVEKIIKAAERQTIRDIARLLFRPEKLKTALVASDNVNFLSNLVQEGKRILS